MEILEDFLRRRKLAATSSDSDHSPSSFTSSEASSFPPPPQFPAGSSKYDKRLDEGRLAAALATDCGCPQHCTTKLRERQLFASVLDRVRYFALKNTDEKHSLFALVRALAYQEERTIGGIVLCQRAISLVFAVSKEKLDHASNVLLSFRAEHPEAVCPLLEELPPHGNALARSLRTPVYDHIFSLTVSYLERHAHREPDGSWRMPCKLAKAELFRLVHPDFLAHISEVSTFLNVLDDLRVHLFDPGITVAVCFRAIAHFVCSGTHPGCKICSRILKSPSSPDLLKLRNVHFSCLNVYERIRKHVFSVSRAEPQRQFSIAFDFASSKYSSIPRLTVQLEGPKLTAHIGGVDVSSLPEGQGYLTFSFGHKDSNLIVNQLILFAQNHKDLYSTCSTAFIFCDTAKENLCQYVAHACAAMVQCHWFNEVFLCTSIPFHSKFWLDQWFSTADSYLSHHEIRSPLELLQCAASVNKIPLLFVNVPDWKGYFESAGGPSIPGIASSHVYLFQRAQNGAAVGYNRLSFNSAGWTGDNGTTSPFCVWMPGVISSAPLRIISHIPDSKPLVRSMRSIMEADPEAFPAGSEQKQWWEHFLLTGKFNIVLPPDSRVSRRIGQQCTMSGKPILAVVEYPAASEIFNCPASWRVDRSSSFPDWKTLQLDSLPNKLVHISRLQLAKQKSADKPPKSAPAAKARNQQAAKAVADIVSSSSAAAAVTKESPGSPRTRSRSESLEREGSSAQPHAKRQRLSAPASCSSSSADTASSTIEPEVEHELEAIEKDEEAEPT